MKKLEQYEFYWIRKGYHQNWSIGQYLGSGNWNTLDNGGKYEIVHQGSMNKIGNKVEKPLEEGFYWVHYQNEWHVGQYLGDEDWYLYADGQVGQYQMGNPTLGGRIHRAEGKQVDLDEGDEDE